MVKYALFVGDTYYPGGGRHDFVAVFDTLDEARAEGKRRIDQRRKDRSGEWYDIMAFGAEHIEWVEEG